MEYIKLKEKKDIFILGIQDENNNIVKDENGKEVCIEFDLGDIELPLKYNRCVKLIEKARNDLKAQMYLIDKKQDRKGKQLLSYNEEQKIKAIHKFYKDMEIAMDLFLGENGTKKFLNGRNPYWEMFDDLAEAIEPHLNKMKITASDMTDKIKNKYKIKADSEVL